MSTQQIAALAYIARNPGCTAADVTRHEWSGRGHAASYARVSRLRDRRYLLGVRVGARIDLYVTDRARAALGQPLLADQAPGVSLGDGNAR